MASVAATTVVPFSHFEQLRVGRSIVAQEGQTLLELSRRLDDNFCAAVEAIIACRGVVIITGVGKAGLIGQKLAATFSSTGTRSFFLHPTEALHGDLGCVSSDDLLLVLSHSGETEEICRLLPYVRQQQAALIAITADARSALGQQASLVVPLGRLAEAGLHGLPPTCSTTAMLAVGDALALVAAEVRGFSPKDFGRLHPAGSLGRRLTPVREVMRRGDELRLAADTATVREAFTAQSKPGRRTGAVMIVDSDRRLAGIFTDSDLARLLEQRREGELDGPIAAVMTASPLTINGDAILDEAVAILSARRLSELPVIDHDGRPIGLIDITDVIGLVPADPGR